MPPREMMVWFVVEEWHPTQLVTTRESRGPLKTSPCELSAIVPAYTCTCPYHCSPVLAVVHGMTIGTGTGHLGAYIRIDKKNDKKKWKQNNEPFFHLLPFLIICFFQSFFTRRQEDCFRDKFILIEQLTRIGYIHNCIFNAI